MYKKIFYEDRLKSFEISLRSMANYKNCIEEPCSICNKVYPIEDMERTKDGEYVCLDHKNIGDIDEKSLNDFVNKLRKR